MADSKLIPPANWSGMTYLEVLWMLHLAACERASVSAQAVARNINPQFTRVHYLTLLKWICSNLKAILGPEPYNESLGYLNPSFDFNAQPFPFTFTATDTRWTMTDMLADIGDPEFYDFAENGLFSNPTPLYDLQREFKDRNGASMPPYLIQYYEIITRLKTTSLSFRPLKDDGKYGSWDDGIEAEGQEVSAGSVNRGRKMIFQLEGQSVGFKDPLESRYELPAQLAGYNSDYGLIYQFPTNSGSSKPGGPGITPELLPQGSLLDWVESNFAGATSLAIPNDFHQIAWTRVKVFIDYQNFNQGGLSRFEGMPQNVRMYYYTENYPDGDLGNPYAVETLIEQPITFTGSVADPWYLGDFPGRPGAAPQIPAGNTQGFEARTWENCIFEDWDYDGGFEYYTP